MIHPFEKFNSLTLIRESREEELTMYRNLAHGERFVVTEKIHGANFEVATDGKDARFARRKGVLEEGDSFYGYQYVSGILAERVISMFNDMKEMIMEQHRVADLLEADGKEFSRPDIPRDFQTLSIRGELAGGHFPDTVQVKEGHGQVGKGKIWYSQDKSFYAFEMCIDGQPVDFYTLGSLCTSGGIPVAPVLFFGTFDECLEYSKEHLEDVSVVSMLQPLLDVDGKPVLQGDNFTHLPFLADNIREGHVIAPVNPKWFPNGKRMIFKHKGTKFSEDTGPKEPRAKVEVELTLPQRYVMDTVLPLLTVNRMEAVCSKEELSDPKDYAKVCGLVVQDAIDEAHGDYPNDFYEMWSQLTTKERKQVTKQLGREACERLREAYFN